MTDAAGVFAGVDDYHRTDCKQWLDSCRRLAHIIMFMYNVGETNGYVAVIKIEEILRRRYH